MGEGRRIVLRCKYPILMRLTPPEQVGHSTSLACSTTSSSGTPEHDPQIYTFRFTIYHRSPKRIRDKETVKQILNVTIPLLKLPCFLNFA